MCVCVLECLLGARIYILINISQAKVLELIAELELVINIE